ncbi:hypothetical protein VYU27_006033 [Nannochloropsis oceanica]
MLPRVSRLAVLLPTAITHTTVCKKICAVTSSRRRPRQDNPPLLPQSLSGLGGGGGRSISTTLPTAAPAPKRAGGGGGPRGKSPNNLAKESAFVINEAIKARTVRLVFKEEGSSGPPTSTVVSRQEALAKAKEVGLDLVLVTTASEPWVCKLMNARREEYQRQKKERRMKKSSNTLKEISIRGNISDHDLLIKLRRVDEFFEQGHSVRVIILPTGSQMNLRPQRLLELRNFILDDYFDNKYKSVVEIQPPTPTSVRREIILHPKRHPSPPPAGGDVPKQIRMKSMPEELGEEEREATTTT